IREMGSNVLKFSMSPRYFWENYDIPKNDNIQSLSDLAQEKNVKKVLDMDFKYYQIWAYEFSQYTQEPAGEKRDEFQIKFIKGLSDEYAEKSYREIYNLASYLLKKYSGTRKVFLLGNWEGDWHLRWDYNRNKPADSLTIEGMKRWLNVRQKAVDDAKIAIPHHDVEVYNYVEVNLSDLAIQGKTCVTNSILPFINPDFVSFSSYTATNPPKTEEQMSANLVEHLDYINSKIQPKEGFSGKRLFIGEYGWSESNYSQQEVNVRAKWVMKAALKWGCPYVLFWEMYNNELDKSGKNIGYWLIDKDDKKTPLYFTHQNFYKEASNYLNKFSLKNNRLPSKEEFSSEVLNFNVLK
ncbi:MAG: hypothetical protein WCJ61_06365, partial [Paludibacter sp.]